jgi:hypothetical protein
MTHTNQRPPTANVKVLDANGAETGATAVTSEWGSTAQFEFRLGSEPTGPILFSVSSLNMNEGAVDNSLLVRAADNWNIPAVITLTGVPDNVDDGDARYQVQIAPIISQDQAYLDMLPALADVTNLDEKGNFVTVTAAPVTCATTEQGGEGSFFVSMAGWSSMAEQRFTRVEVVVVSQNVQEGMLVLPSAQGGSEVNKVAVVTFTESDWSTPKLVTVRGMEGEGHSNCTVTHTNHGARHGRRPLLRREQAVRRDAARHRVLQDSGQRRGEREGAQSAGLGGQDHVAGGVRERRQRQAAAAVPAREGLLRHQVRDSLSAL